MFSLDTEKWKLNCIVLVRSNWCLKHWCEELLVFVRLYL